jgi:hypothetical protein
MGSLDQALAASLIEVLERCTRGEVLLGDAHGIAHVAFNKVVEGAFVTLLHAEIEVVLLLGGEGLTLAEVSLDSLYAVYIVVDDGDVLAVLVHIPLH